MRKTISITMCDTSYIPTYEEYVENCEAIGEEPMGEDSGSYWEFVSDTQEREFDDMIENLKYSDEGNTPCVITGKLGLWNGSPEINPVYCETLADALKRCFGSADHLKVTYENGVVYANASHHDGTNRFEIHKLSKRGIEACEKWVLNTYWKAEHKDYWFAKYHGYLY